jgi:hypothetical protein
MIGINIYEKSVFSQNGEDGVIEHIFNNIGFTNKIFVEFGFHYNQNNSKNLINNHNFKGLFIDGNVPNNIKNKTINDITYREEWITKNNINNIISKHYTGNIDFLSIDVDGVDLYLLDEINVINPRLVCIEYCSSIGKDLSVTVKYKDDFDRHKEHPSGFYCNASLKATINVMKKKNYKFVASVYGLNAFFVRNDCDLNLLKELTCEEGWQPHHSRTYEDSRRYDGKNRKVSIEEQFNLIKDLEWIKVNDNGIIMT